MPWAWQSPGVARTKADHMEQPTRSSAQYRIMAVLAAITVILGVVALLALRTTTRMIGERDWIAHSHHVLAELQETRGLLDDAEDQQRGYLLTGDPSLLNPFEGTGQRFQAKLDSLR